VAEGKREYVAIFSIGAKLLGSFKGAMSQAKARLTELMRTAKGIGSVFKGIGIGLAGVAASVAGTMLGMVGHQIWSMMRKVWEGAISNAEQAADRQRTLLAYLNMDVDFRKKGNAFIQSQIDLLDKHNEKLAEQTGMSQDIYDQSNKTLVKYGAMPHTLAQMAGPLGDFLAATKGPRASMEDMAQLSDQIGNAMVGGPITQLRRMGLLTEGVKKDWSKMTKAARLQVIMKSLKKFEGEAKKAMDTPIGRVVKFENAMDKLSNTVGEHLLPAMGDVADMWRAVLETPAFQGAMIAGAKAFASIQKSIAEYVLTKLIPAFNQLSDNPVWKQMQETAGAFFSFLGDEIIKVGEEFGKMWESTLRELQVVLGGMSMLSSKFEEPYRKVSLMVGEIDAAKNLLKAPALPPPILAGTGAAPPPAFSAVGLLPEQLQKSADAFDMLANKSEIAYQSIVKPAIDVRPEWQKFGDTLVAANTQIGASIDQRLKIPFEAVKTTIAAVKGDWSGMTEHAVNTQEETKTALSQTAMAITAAITTPLNLAKNAWDSLKASMSGGITIPAVQAPAAALPNPPPAELGAVPSMQFGGVFNKPTIAQIGEAGPEAVIPLSRGLRSLGSPSGGATSVNFAPVITINGNATEDEQRSMDTKLRDLAKDFIAQFKAAQYQERRLSYESGYG
jgi:hypothetical protein